MLHVAPPTLSSWRCAIRSPTSMPHPLFFNTGIEYSPGDALGILPLNDPGKVAELLEVWGVDGAETVATPDWDAPAHDRTTLPLREALERCYDIREPKVRGFGGTVMCV